MKVLLYDRGQTGRGEGCPTVRSGSSRGVPRARCVQYRSWADTMYMVLWPFLRLRLSGTGPEATGTAREPAGRIFQVPGYCIALQALG